MNGYLILDALRGTHIHSDTLVPYFGIPQPDSDGSKMAKTTFAMSFSALLFSIHVNAKSVEVDSLVSYESQGHSMYFYSHTEVPLLCVVVLSDPMSTVGIILARDICNSFLETFRSDFVVRAQGGHSAVVKKYKRSFQPVAYMAMLRALRESIIEDMRVAVEATMLSVCYAPTPAEFLELSAPEEGAERCFTWEAVSKVVNVVNPTRELTYFLGPHRVTVLVIKQELYVTLVQPAENGLRDYRLRLHKYLDWVYRYLKIVHASTSKPSASTGVEVNPTVIPV